jgi:hypothetical protein
LNIFFTYFTICVEKDGNQVFRIDEIWDIDIENPSNKWVSCELIDIQNLNNKTFDEHQYTNTVNHIELFDIQGKRAMTTSLANSNQVDVSHLSSGIYFIKFDTDKNSKINHLQKSHGFL